MHYGFESHLTGNDTADFPIEGSGKEGAEEHCRTNAMSHNLHSFLHKNGNSNMSSKCIRFTSVDRPLRDKKNVLSV